MIKYGNPTRGLYFSDVYLFCLGSYVSVYYFFHTFPTPPLLQTRHCILIRFVCRLFSTMRRLFIVDQAIVSLNVGDIY